MLIKEADDRSVDVTELNALLLQPGVTAKQKQDIRQEIRNIEKGAWGEEQAAYYLNFHFASYKNSIILHDLRFVLSNDKTAQIDHLIIHRFTGATILESKNWDQLTVDESGACTIWDGRIVGVPSPLEQCRRHANVLARVFELDPRLKSLAGRPIQSRVLVSAQCHLKAPHHRDQYLKADAFHSVWEKEYENTSAVKALVAVARGVSLAELEVIGHAICELHNPTKRDWKQRFGIHSPAPHRVVTAIPGLAAQVPRWGEDWFALHGKPSDETKKAIKSAGYRACQENGEWIWRLKK